jgi:hypothetical protein
MRFEGAVFMRALILFSLLLTACVADYNPFAE